MNERALYVGEELNFSAGMRFIAVAFQIINLPTPLVILTRICKAISSDLNRWEAALLLA